MAQASSSWRQLFNQIPNWSLPEIKTGSPQQRKLQRFSEPGGILGFLTIVVAMLLWNWKLLLALLFGIGVMVLAYSMQKWDWQKRLFDLRRFLTSSNRRLVLAAATGGITTVSTYMAMTIWIDSNSPWLAVGVIVESVGILLTLFLLVWQIFSLYGNREEDHIDQLLLNLTETDPLKRLLAVRQLTKFITRKGVDVSVQQDVIECLRILLSREEEAVIREAAINSLQALDRLHILPSSAAATFTPVPTKAKARILA